MENFLLLTRKQIDLSVDGNRVAFWTSTQFRIECVLNFGLSVQDDINDRDFIGGRLEVQTHQGSVLECMIVDYQADIVIALPFRLKGEESEDATVGIMMMLGENEYKGEKDRDLFAAASPKRLLSLTVELTSGEHE